MGGAAPCRREGPGSGADTEGVTEYLADPTMVDVPFNLAEIEQVAADQARALKDPRKAQHFVQRTLSTVRMLKQQIQQLHRDVQTIQMDKERAGAATTLSPLDAVRYLSEEQLEQLFGVLARQQLQRLRTLQTDARCVAEQANRELAQAHTAIAAVRAAGLPPELAGTFEDVLARLPEPHEVPEMIDPSAPPGAAPQPAELVGAEASGHERGAGWAAWGASPGGQN